jgi:hypothetical protein
MRIRIHIYIGIFAINTVEKIVHSTTLFATKHISNVTNQNASSPHFLYMSQGVMLQKLVSDLWSDVSCNRLYTLERYATRSCSLLYLKIIRTLLYSSLGIAGLIWNILNTWNKLDPTTKKTNIPTIQGFSLRLSSLSVDFFAVTFPLLVMFWSNLLDLLRSLRGAGYMSQMKEKTVLLIFCCQT